jgi:hypothetical protein
MNDAGSFRGASIFSFLGSTRNDHGDIHQQYKALGETSAEIQLGLGVNSNLGDGLDVCYSFTLLRPKVASFSPYVYCPRMICGLSGQPEMNTKSQRKGQGDTSYNASRSPWELSVQLIARRIPDVTSKETLSPSTL